MDPRYTQLADRLIGFSTSVRKNDRVCIDAHDVPDDIVIALIREVRRRGAVPFVDIHRAGITREMLREGEEEAQAQNAAFALRRMKRMDAYVALRGASNIYELSDVPADKMQQYVKSTRRVTNWRVRNTRWVVLRWPTPSMAQQARQSTEAFEDFFFRVCTLDYSRMIPGMRALQKLMERTDRVHIKGPGTDLRFSIEDIGVVSCGGRHNIPDGEVFTCPLKNSVEGELTYNVPTLHQGASLDGIRFLFRKGRIVEASASDSALLNRILDSDRGARYIGEFSLGFNPHILEPMLDTLFDEKIAGSFHFTPGQAYDEADNGNRSQVHWDLVSIQRATHGGGEIYFDGKLIRKDGLFVPKSLRKLNPQHLLNHNDTE
jgi:aminopeptidase